MVFDNGLVTDLVGNVVRRVSGDRVYTYKPSNQVYAFPFRSGGTWNLVFKTEHDGRSFDNKVKIVMGGEEDVPTPAGTLRAVKLQRTNEWKERGKDNSGTFTSSYWYSGAVKRIVAEEIKDTTSAGRVLRHERIELEKYEVR